MISFNRPTATTAAAALFGAIVFASPVFAASKQVAQGSSEQAMAAPGAESPAHEGVEARIKDLHRRLKITDAQKAQWDALTQVMRDNAQKMTDLEKQRVADAKAMTAVDVVKSYSEVIEAHEEGMKKFIPAFDDLYNSMSDSQKKIADSMFRSRARTEAKKEVSKQS